MSDAIATPLLAWWDVHGRRDLPWQQYPEPYRVWVSEIMLQQTQVATVERYYQRFMERFPDVSALAAADTDAVLHHWSGLGYYSRARNLHKAAQIIVSDWGGELPHRLDDLIALPGIGRSTAGAILALSRQQRQPILDGNVKRVLARYFALTGWTGTTRNLKTLWQHAEDCTPHDRVDNYTQAIMDLGATVCRRSRPACERCPLRDNCAAHARGLTGEIPAPRPKKARPLRSAVLLMARHGDSVLLEKRPPTGIWGGLWSFPEFATADEATAWLTQTFAVVPGRQQAWPLVEHAFSHFDLQMHPLEVEINQLEAKPIAQGVAEADGWRWVDPADPAGLGLAAPVARILEGLAYSLTSQGGRPKSDPA